MRRIAVLDAPSNLGLRPPTATSVPGCAKAPGALRDHGLLTRLGARDAGCLTPPRYDAGDWRPGDGVAHASQIAAYSRALADRIGAILDAGEFPVILGGDCSILLGSGIAMHRLGEAIGGQIGLVFVDGHSDFRHPGNASYVGAAAGEDLALVTGRGQPDLAAIEGRRPYFRDIDVVVLGIRAQDEHRLDLQAAGIVNRPVPALRAEGAARSAQWAREQLADCAGYWVHIDVDVLDPAVMPAVDAPSPGGIAFPELELLLAGLVESPHCLGVEITVFDPDYDPDGEYAAEITSALSAGLAAAHRVALRPDLAAARRDLDGATEGAEPSEPDPLRPGESHPGEAARLGPVARFGLAADRDDQAEDDDQAENDEEAAREHRRAEAAAGSVSLAAAGASGGVSGTPDEPALPATTLLAIEEGAELPPQQPLPDAPDDTAPDDTAPDDTASDDTGEPSDEAVTGPFDEPSDEALGEPSDKVAGELGDAIPDDDLPAAVEAEAAGPADSAEVDWQPVESAQDDLEPTGLALDDNPSPADAAHKATGLEATGLEATGLEEAATEESATEESGLADGDAGHHDPAEHEDGRTNGKRSRLRPRNGAPGKDIAVQLLSRPLGSAPLLDSEPLPATRPGMLRPRRTEPDDEVSDARASEGFSLPVQRPAFDVGSDEPADIA